MDGSIQRVRYTGTRPSHGTICVPFSNILLLFLVHCCRIVCREAVYAYIDWCRDICLCVYVYICTYIHIHICIYMYVYIISYISYICK